LELRGWSRPYQYENQEGEKSQHKKQFPNGNILKGYDHFHFSSPPWAMIDNRARKEGFTRLRKLHAEKKGS